MQKLFIDSSYFIALQLRNEQNHQFALTHWQGLDRSQCFVTTSFIFDEKETRRLLAIPDNKLSLLFFR